MHIKLRLLKFVSYFLAYQLSLDTKIVIRKFLLSLNK